jgi:hypothetical protein
MTDLKPDLVDALIPKELRPFEHRDVIASKIEIPGAAGGLRDAMQVEPVQLGHDEEVVLVMKCRVKKVRFDEVKDGEGTLVRVHVLEPLANETAFIDEEFVRDHMAEYRDRIRRARERAAGIERIPFDSIEGGDDEGESF